MIDEKKPRQVVFGPWDHCANRNMVAWAEEKDRTIVHEEVAWATSNEDEILRCMKVCTQWHYSNFIFSPE